MSKENVEILLSLINDSNAKNELDYLCSALTIYLDNEEDYKNQVSDELKKDIEKIFWKFPLLVSSYYESKESFLKFDLAFRPKLRGQHGAGITSLENEITNKYHKYGNNDKDIFLNLSSELFR